MLLGLPAGGFDTPLAAPTLAVPGSVVAADLNGDGAPDLAASALTLGEATVGVFLAQPAPGEFALKGVPQRFPCFPSCRVATRTKRHT